MKNRKSERAFTLTELMVVCLATIILAVMVFSALVSTGRQSQRNSCANNLKQVGVAFRVWEGDNGDKYPMAVSTLDGGALENVWSALNTFIGNQYGVTNVFTVMSNEISNPKLLACPADAGKSAIGYWTNANFQANVSYFVGGDASDTYPQMVLSGDRNVGTVNPGTLAPAVTTNVSSSYAAATQLLWLKASWTATDLHQKVGNIGLADGGVQQVTIGGLQAALQAATNGAPVSAPAYNFPN